MQKPIGIGLVVLGLLLGASAAGAEQYNVAVSAGNNGDSHGGDNSDPDAQASFERDEEPGGAEFYEARADSSTGSLSASAVRVDPLPAGVSTSAGAIIEETIHFEELPASTVTIRASLGVGLGVTAASGVARAGARVTLRAAPGECNRTMSDHSALGPDENGSCNTASGSTGSGYVELVLTGDQLLDSNLEVDIEASVSAELENLGAGIDGSASASGGAGLSRGGEPLPGTIYVNIDPPLAHTYTGSMTAFPVLAPEPGAPLLLAVGAGIGLAFSRSRR